ncbi:hypothetical protein DSCA_23230 [Desulfosarcina alkanivorans]|uniref:Glycosyl transferase family 1 domain-containing protein n=2 Tax=Desulfosarcina alkanivorans TaxID=571177 RepID=A0A5K7YIN3_9BACT|nr:hypothetical protein DSCA_23230 [Desulfosarcina alkanivorans]
MGYKVVMTNHGPEYDRQKWGPLARWVLRTGEYLGGKFSHEVIVISEIIENIVHKRCGKNANLIFNGVPIPEKRVETCHLDGIGVSKNNYFLAVARFVPEKGLHDLVKAFQHVQGEFKLVIAGDADHETAYSNHLKSLVQKDPRIKLTGYVNGEYLSQLYSNAALFVLPSYHEGLPIALLEAMSYGCPPLVSDIPANRAVDLDPRYYFPCGDVRALGKKLCSFIDRPISGVKRAAFQGIVADKYNWDVIAHQTLAVYEKLIL